MADPYVEVLDNWSYKNIFLIYTCIINYYSAPHKKIGIILIKYIRNK